MRPARVLDPDQQAPRFLIQPTACLLIRLHHFRRTNGFDGNVGYLHRFTAIFFFLESRTLVFCMAIVAAPDWMGCE
jgi:hypothetical protein